MPAPPKPVNVTLIGTGGSVIEFELPLQFEGYTQQLQDGRLRPADAKSAALLVEHGYPSGP